VEKNLAFADLLRLADERAATFRAVIAAAPDLGVQVPTCPEWTLLDLAEHIGQGRRKWAAIVAAGPAEAPPAPEVWSTEVPRERDELVAWLAAGQEQLAAALREAGPDRGLWAWWGESQSPTTAGAAARRQLHEVAVHTYDAQVAVGAPQPIPAEIAVDGVEEFHLTCVASSGAWPHEPATVDYHATEGRSWRLHLTAPGARTERLADGTDHGPADVAATGTASDVVLTVHGRTGLDTLKLDGDRRVYDQLTAW
jgi:uncharacterized protein (TIGR03083 family)